MKTLRQNILDMREALGLTQQELSRALDVSIRTIVRWEHGQYPGEESLDRLRNFAESRGLPLIAASFPRSLRSFEERESRRVNVKDEEDGMFAELVEDCEKNGYELAIYRKAKS